MKIKNAVKNTKFIEDTNKKKNQLQVNILFNQVHVIRTCTSFQI